MLKPNVYYYSLTDVAHPDISNAARKLLETLIREEHITLQNEIPLKVHPGEPGNTSFVRPTNYDGIIDFLEEKNIKTYFIETNTVTGRRTNELDHQQVAKEHGFTRIPFVVADGERGTNDVAVAVKGGLHLQHAKIATRLADKNQIIILSHFKGHVSAGFGAALKMLGIGFASRRGKMDAHCKVAPPDDGTINWVTDRSNLYSNEPFRQRMVEYAQAAVNEKKYLYITYAINLVENCDCDSKPMEPICRDLGIFASIDPVAIDKTVLDELAKREGKMPFAGGEALAYAEKLGLGSQKYNLVSMH